MVSYEVQRVLPFLPIRVCTKSSGCLEAGTASFSGNVLFLCQSLSAQTALWKLLSPLAIARGSRREHFFHSDVVDSLPDRGCSGHHMYIFKLFPRCFCGFRGSFHLHYLSPGFAWVHRHPVPCKGRMLPYSLVSLHAVNQPAFQRQLAETWEENKTQLVLHSLGNERLGS